MKLPLLACLGTALLAIAPSPQPLRASTGIQRCVTSDGVAVYTDKACAAFGAQATPIAGEVLTRIAADERRHAGSEATPALPTLAARRSAQAGCARTPEQLAADVRGSFALHDVNRIAESYHWAGMQHAQAQQVMSRLQSLSRGEVRDARYFNAQIASLSPEGATHMLGGDAGVLQLQLAGRASAVIDFDVVEYADCYFVNF